MGTLSEALSAHQNEVAERALAEEARDRRHMVVCLSGAHAYGFPSPDSDLDLKAVHIEPTANLLGLRMPRETRNRLEIIDGVEIDYTSNELGPFLRGILAGNGNYLERVLGPLLLVRSPELESLQPVVERAIAKNSYRHYRGFARSQLQAVQEADTPTAKKVLYVLRTTMTGAHLLRAGELVTDVRELLDDYGFSEAHELIETKRAGEQVTLDGDRKDHWLAVLARAFETLDQAHATSELPDTPSNAAEVQDWLVATRRAAL